MKINQLSFGKGVFGLNIRPDYKITRQLIFFTGIYDREGKLCTLVRELNRTFIVDKSPLEILKDSMIKAGFNYRGAVASSKEILSMKMMVPVMVNPFLKIYLFPTKSANSSEVTWFNPNHLLRTISHNGATLIEFSNGQTMVFPSKLGPFNTKITAAEQLKKFTLATAQQTNYYIAFPKKKKTSSITTPKSKKSKHTIHSKK